MKLALNTSYLIIRRQFYGSQNLIARSKHLFGSTTKPSRFLDHRPSSVRNLLNINKRCIYDDRELDNVEETNDAIEEYQEEMFKQPESIRNLLYPDSKDNLIITLNKCGSVQDVLSFINEHELNLGSRHITQVILVLWDLQKMYNHFSFMNSISQIDTSKLYKLNEEYISKLSENAGFIKLLEFLTDRSEEFTAEQLSFILLHLNRIGFSVKNKTLQLLIGHLRNRFSSGEYSLKSLSQFLMCVHKVEDLSYYYIVQDIVPVIFNQVDKCATAEEFKLTTSCLSNLVQFVGYDVLLDYKNKARKLLNDGVVTAEDYRTILRIILFLNHPQWRETNVTLMSKCLMLLKNHLHLLDVNELLAVNEVLYRNQEPGDILNELQRCATRFLIQLEEDLGPLDVRLRLLSCIVCFSSPSQRTHFEKIIRKYVDYSLTTNSLLPLYKVILFNRTTDTVIYKMFWRRMLTSLEDQAFREASLLKICHNYIVFNQSSNSHRYRDFELRVLKWLEIELNKGIYAFIPSRFSSLVSFILIYNRDEQLLKYCIKKMEENIERFNYVDCHNISRSLEVAIEIVKNQLLKPKVVDDIKLMLDRCTYNNLFKDSDLSVTNLLFKSYIYRDSSDEKLLSELIGCYGTDQKLSSKLIKNICFCLQSTSILLPDVVDKMVEYVIHHKENVLAFTAERIVYLSYYLGYLPKNSKEFFKAVIDITLRDQERLSGLSYLQTCLSLACFQVLPLSFVQQIFNVEFLDKLDTELINCYFKETYPLRVRNKMMQLNRTVCLDYPESKVPWFHQKYMAGFKNRAQDSDKTYHYTDTISDYLLQVTGDSKNILQNVITPYGYRIDFVINLDKEHRVTNLENSVHKIAILLLRPSAYTNVNVQLRGKYLLKVRHLEILGYRVVIVNFKELNSLPYGEEKIKYLKDLIWPSITHSNILVNR